MMTGFRSLLKLTFLLQLVTNIYSYITCPTSPKSIFATKVRCLVNKKSKLRSTSRDVDELLEKVSTSKSSNLSKEDRDFIRRKIDKLILYQQTSKNVTNPLKDSRIFGNYGVTYVSDKNENDKKSGGFLRKFVGKYLFQTELFQNIFPTDEKDHKGETGLYILNSVYGRLFNLLPFHVILWGIARALTTREISQANAAHGKSFGDATVEVKFDKPMFCFGSPKGFGLRLTCGLESTVLIDTPYLDDKIRIATDSKGSNFIFQRVNDDRAEKWLHWTANRMLMGHPKLGRGVGFLMLLAGFLSPILKTHFKLPQFNWASVAGSVALSCIGFLIVLWSFDS